MNSPRKSIIRPATNLLEISIVAVSKWLLHSLAASLSKSSELPTSIAAAIIKDTSRGRISTCFINCLAEASPRFSEAILSIPLAIVLFVIACFAIVSESYQEVPMEMSRLSGLAS
jgi:hypothetical protein